MSGLTKNVGSRLDSHETDLLATAEDKFLTNRPHGKESSGLLSCLEKDERVCVQCNLSGTEERKSDNEMSSLMTDLELS